MARKSRSKASSIKQVENVKTGHYNIRKLLKFKNEAQKEAYDIIKNNRITFLCGPAGTAKAQPLDSIVYTPSGPIEMGKIKIGMKICTPNGKTAKVVGVFPQGKKDIYKITFSNGDFVKCCEDHLWKVDSESTNRWKNKILDTKYLINNYKSTNGRNKFTIETPRDVFFEKKQIFLDPYVMGILLGDGSLTTNPIFTTEDCEIYENIKEILNTKFNVQKIKSSKCSYSITNIGKKRENKLKKFLEEKILNVTSEKKYIPEEYKYNSKEIRLSLIQGLMDSDGSCDKYCAWFCTSSKVMANDFKEIIESLGGLCKIIDFIPTFKYNGEKKQGKKAYRCYPKLNNMKSLFNLRRKKDRISNKKKYFVKRIISNIEMVGKENSQCIMIDSEDHLYLTNNFIVTHNTFLSVYFALDELYKGDINKIIFTRPMIEAAGEKMGFLPGPQPLDAKILTPNGWVLMGDLKIGDFVIARDGNSSRVLNIYPKGNKKVYKITTNEGNFTECCEDHLWLTQNTEERKRKKSGKIRTTMEIMNSLNHKKSKTNFNHSLPRNECINFNFKELPIPSYTLGTLLGDGHFGDSILVASEDEEIINRIKNEMKIFNVDLVKCKNSILYNFRGNVKNNKPARPIKTVDITTKEECVFETIGSATGILGMKKNDIASSCNIGTIRQNKKFKFLKKNIKWTNIIKQKLEKLNLLKTRSFNKFIPKDYIYKASIKDRISLLQGLMDTDGNCNRRGNYCEATFTTVSEQLAKDLRDLVKTLGGRSYIRERDRRLREKPSMKGREIKSNYIVYEVSVNTPKGINPFHLKRKASQYSKKYMQYEKIKSVEFVGEKNTQCILIDNPEHLYITDNFIVTHNTLNEKIAPYMSPVFDFVEGILDEKEIEQHISQKTIEVIPMAFMRGKNFHDSIVVSDESQNMNFDQITMLLSRIGEKSKIILTGDSMQSDRSSCCFDNVAKGLSGLDFVGYFKFGKEHIVRDSIIAELLDKLNEIKNGWE